MATAVNVVEVVVEDMAAVMVESMVEVSILLVFLLGLVTSRTIASSLNRSSFPDSFIFGVGSSAYQIEGAAKEDGRGPSTWDTFTHTHPEKVGGGGNGDVAADFYHRYKEDIKIMKHLNIDAIRISISWSRILPNGTLSGGVNKKGIEHYNNVIDELLSNGITPFVTIFHWDLPQALEDGYGGFLSPLIVNDFRDYANICFKYFGDRVKHWNTLNEPWIFSNVGYGMNIFPPNHCSTRESLLVSHHQILSHVAATNLYKTKYQGTQKGKIGITMLADWVKGYSRPNSTNINHNDLKRQIKLNLDFTLGTFLGPLVRGDYPSSLRRLVGDQLPEFTEEQSKMMQNSPFDFLGLNYYSSFLVTADRPKPADLQGISCATDVAHFVSYIEPDGKISQSTRQGIPDSSHLYPKEIRDMLRYVNREYNHPTIYIMENGKEQAYNNNTNVKEALRDKFRIHYITKHLKWVQKAIMEGINVKGYFMWSLLDGFEWTAGYNIGCGLYYVDYKNDLKRIPKYSARWFRKFLHK